MTFDPYHKWLGIAPKDQPPNHYRLLGIDLFEADPDVIDAAANRQMSYLQQRAHGKHADLSQKLLNEIAAARVCLLNRKKKAEYDAALRRALAEREENAEQPTHLSTADVPLQQGVLKPLRPSRVRHRFRPEPWHYAVAIGVLSLVGIGVWAILGAGRSEQTTASTGIAPGTNPKQGPAPLPNIAQPASSEEPFSSPTADKVKPAPMPPDSSSGSSGDNTDTWTPCIYHLTIEPAWADVDVIYDKANMTGSGSQRTLSINERTKEGVQVVIKCDGYQPRTEWLTPESGKNRFLQVSLEKSQESRNALRPLPRFHGCTRYDKSSGVASFAYDFHNSYELDDFNVRNRDKATISNGYLRLSDENSAFHRACFRTVRVEATANISENEYSHVNLIVASGVGIGQLFPKTRNHHIYIGKGKETKFVPVPSWNGRNVSFVFDIREDEVELSVNGKAVTWKGRPNTPDGTRIALWSKKGTVSYSNVKIEGVLDSAWAATQPAGH